MLLRITSVFALLLALDLLAAPVLAAAPAQPDLMLYPTRVVLQRASRSAQVDLVNNSAETATYRLRLVDRRMNADGGLSQAIDTDADQKSAASMLRYSPRQVVLAPGASQTVRIMLRKPPDLAAGEYRSHLLFERIGATAPVEPTTGVARDVQIQLQALVSVSIPIIVRHGETQARVAIAEPALVAQPGGSPVLSFVLQREGNRSVFGDLIATWVGTGGVQTQIGQASGVAVYTPNPMRRVRLAVSAPPGAASGGFVRIDFKDRPEDGDAHATAQTATQ